MLNLEVNKNLLPMKGHYFLWNAGTAPVVPFMSVYAKQLGFSSFIVGIIYTVLPFSGMLAKPIMGGVADRYRCQKTIFLIAQLIAAAAFLAMIFLPEVPTTSKIHFACDNSEVALDTCSSNNTHATEQFKDEISNNETLCQMNCPLQPEQWSTICDHWNGEDYCTSHPDSLSFTAHVPSNLTVSIGDCIFFRVKNITFENGKTSYPNCLDRKISTICDIKCDSYAINDIVSQPTLEDDHVVGQYQFWLLLGVYLVGWVGQAVTVSVGDAICFQLLGDKPHKYGYQRMCGALGWGVFSIISGILVDVFSHNSAKKNYGPVFGIGVAILLLCVVVSYQIKYTQQHISASILRDISRLLANVRIFIFMLWCICVGLCTALMWNFFFWLLEELAEKQGGDVLSWIKTIEGLVMGIQCLGGELPFFFLSSWILKRIGHVHAMSLVLLVIGVRFILYSILTNPWWCLPIEFCNGLTFGLFYATMASYASIVAPPGTETTTQGLVGAVFEGVGVSLGSFIGGVLFQDVGGSMTFRIFGISALVACLLHATVQYLIQRSTSQDKDSMAKYAAPQDAIDMINDDQQELKLVGS